MLQQVRNRVRGWLVWILSVCLILAFALWGLEHYFTPSSKNQAASVNGTEISWRAVEKLYESLLQERELSVVDKEQEKALKEEALQSLVQRSALLSAAKSQHFLTTENQLIKLLTRIPAFQVDGKFSKEQYQKVLNSLSYTDAAFQQMLAEDLILDQFPQGVINSSFILPTEVNRAIELAEQKREFGYFKIPFKKYHAEIKISQSDIQDYYKANKNEFFSKEQMKLEYVVLSIKKLLSEVTVAEKEVVDFYKQHPDLYTTPDSVHASHILISVPKDATTEEDKAAKTTAEDVVKKIHAGENFARLAQQFSADPGSAKKGGDLGWFGRGEMVREFEEAAFSLKNKGQVTLVRSDFGYHIIQLLDKKVSRVQPFTEVKRQVFENIRREKAENLFSEKSEQLATLAFENSDTLKPIVQQMGLEIQETEYFDRSGGKGIARFPAVITQAFSESVLNRKKNSELIQLDEDSYAVIRMKEYKPSKEKPLIEVETAIRERLLKMAALDKARILGETLAKQLQSGQSSAQLAAMHHLSWVDVKNATRTSREIPLRLLEAVFTLPRPKHHQKNTQGSVTHFVLDDSHYAVVSLLKVTNGQVPDLNSEKIKTYRFDLAQLLGRIEYALYTNEIMKKANIKVYKAP